MLHSKFDRSRDQAAAMIHVSPRLVIHATKVIKDGCDDLVAAVESGELKVSTASALARLPQPEQARLLADGPKQAARRVRELHAFPNDGPCFGVVEGSDDGATARLWLDSEGLAAAIRALQAGSFRYAGGVTRTGTSPESLDI